MPAQKDLFGDEPAPWEADDQSDELVATVVFTEGPGGEFDYSVPDRWANEIEAGRRVCVPLGRSNRRTTGYCVGVERKPITARRLKPIEQVLDRRSLLSGAMLRLTHWIAEHYLCEWGQVLEAVVPMGVRQQAGTHLATRLSVDRELAGLIQSLKLSKTQAAILTPGGQSGSADTGRTLPGGQVLAGPDRYAPP